MAIRELGGVARWHPALVEAALAMNEDRLDVAERILKPHLKDDPFDVRAIRKLAARVGRLKDSETLLRWALEIAPGFTIWCFRTQRSSTRGGIRSAAAWIFRSTGGREACG